MKLKIILITMCMVPVMASAADRSEARIGVNRVSQAATRAPTTVKNLGVPDGNSVPSVSTTIVELADFTAPSPSPATPSPKPKTKPADVTETTEPPKVSEPVAPVSCRESYRNCMDEFCLLDESEGARCACSANIDQSKKIIQDILKIQEDAEKLYSEGVEREKLGARAKLVFGESEKAKRSSRASGLSFSDWLKTGFDDEDALDTDYDIGAGLYGMASEFCADKLKACDANAEMEEVLYSRVLVQDCKDFSSYLNGQKQDAERNKKTAEAAVRNARLELLNRDDETNPNRYNRGECLMGYRACIAEKGGCGANFENCLDERLLALRANMCENILDQCMAVRDYVLIDWAEESKMVLADAAKFADKNRRATCFAKIQLCLEEGCKPTTNPGCLNDINVAAGTCPIIDECNEIIPGIKNSVVDNLGFLRLQFCKNDVEKCLQENCGKNYNNKACMQKTTSEIIDMCPQKSFPSCKDASQYNIIVSSALMQLDYQMMLACVNHFSEKLSESMGTDMAKLPMDDTVMALTSLPDTDEGMRALRAQVRENSKTAVAAFFKDFEKDATVAACKGSDKPGGQKGMGENIFNTAKLIAEIGAENRALRLLDTRMAEIMTAEDLAAAEKLCYAKYQKETPVKGEQNYSYITDVQFESSLSNCKVCRKQQVCEQGGEDEKTAGMKGAAGMGASLAAAGTMAMPGWGTAIGAVAGTVGGFAMGYMSSSGEKEFCQQITSCEDVNIKVTPGSSRRGSGTPTRPER